MSSDISSSTSSKWTTIRKHPGFIAAVAASGALAVAGAYYIFRCRKTRCAHSTSEDDYHPMAALFPTLTTLDEAFSDVSDEFDTSTDSLKKIMAGMQNEMVQGLQKHSESSLKMLPSFVDKTVLQASSQIVYAVDMGGTNLRVMQVRLEPGGQSIELHSKKTAIPSHLMTDTGAKLFDFIAVTIIDAIGDLPPDGTVPQLGFTFSYPTNQTAINRGTLVEWTKGFTASGVAGYDVAELLNQALEKLGSKLRVTALVNDTVGVLLTGAFASQNPNTLIGLILGTGTNACYVENAENIVKWEGAPIETGKMIINIEWGAFDSPVYKSLPQTKYDVELDLTSNNPKKQHFEKMLSGMYLGEIVRLILQDYCASINLFGGQTSDHISTAHRFETQFMSTIEADDTEDLRAVSNTLKCIGIHQTTKPIRRFVQNICRIVSRRSARLAATGIAAIIHHLGRQYEPVNVAIDGSVYELYPGYREMMQTTLIELGFQQVTLSLAKDGSGNGAAITAAIMATH